MGVEGVIFVSTNQTVLKPYHPIWDSFISVEGAYLLLAQVV